MFLSIPQMRHFNSSSTWPSLVYWLDLWVVHRHQFGLARDSKLVCCLQSINSTPQADNSFCVWNSMIWTSPQQQQTVPAINFKVGTQTDWFKETSGFQRLARAKLVLKSEARRQIPKIAKTKWNVIASTATRKARLPLRLWFLQNLRLHQ